MKPAFRRVPRRIGGDDDTAAEAAEANAPAVVKRPALPKVKKSSQLRASFLSNDDEDEPAASVVTKPSLKRRVLENALKKDVADSAPRLGLGEDRPSYSSEYLDELRSSTPNTPASLTDVSVVPAFSNTTLITPGDSILSTAEAYIPTDAEIQEKKERRRRLAQEQDYISLSDPGDGAAKVEESRSRSLIIPAEEVNIASKYAETRLVHEDEDIAEGFDEFVEDVGKVALGRKAAKKQKETRRKEMADQIRAAQHGYGYSAALSGSSDEDDDGENGQDEVDADDVRRNVAYEAAQTKAGTYVSRSTTSSHHSSSREKEEQERKRLQIPKTKPIPELKNVLLQFKEYLEQQRSGIAEKQQQIQTLQQEEKDIAEEEVRIKQLLQESGQKYEQIKADAAPVVENGLRHGGVLGLNGHPTTDSAMDTYRSVLVSHQQPAFVPPPAPDSSDDEAPGGLGSLNGRAGLGGFSGMGQMPRDEEDDYY